MVYTIKFLIDSISIKAKGVLRPNSDSLDYKIYAGDKWKFMKEKYISMYLQYKFCNLKSQNCVSTRL